MRIHGSRNYVGRPIFLHAHDLIITSLRPDDAQERRGAVHQTTAFDPRPPAAWEGQSM